MKKCRRGPRTLRRSRRRFFEASESTKVSPLLDLPRELIDQILHDTLHLPYHLTGGGRESLDIGDILTLPILITCKIIRQRGLQLIKGSCMWIRIGWHSAEELAVIRKWLIGGTRTIPCGWRPFFDDKLPMVDILLGSDTLTATGDRVLASHTKSILLPFSYSVWLQIFKGIQDSQSHWPLRRRFGKALTLRCYPWQSSMNDFWRDFVWPPFLMLRGMRAVGFHGDMLGDFQRTHRSMMVGKQDVYGELQDLIAILKQIASFDSRSETVSACLLALYSNHKTQIKCELARYRSLLSPHEYFVQCSISKCWYIMEKRRFTSYFDFRYAWKLQWPKNIVSWLTTPMCWWHHTIYRRGILLRCVERARLHQMLAVSMLTEARLEAGLGPFDNGKRALRHNGKYRRDCAEAAVHAQISRRLLQKMGVSEGGSDVQKIIDKEPRMDVPDDEYVELHNVRGTGYYWAGHKAMLRSSYPSVFNYLPLAAGLPEIFTSDDDLRVFADEFSQKTVYCGKPCHCTVF